MYTITDNRERGLIAASAALRAMERQVCCTSQFKFNCFSCGEMINRGDKITRCNRATNAMTLRVRGADSQNGLNQDECILYQGTSGSNMWVHIGCNPCYWVSLPEDSNEYSPPALCPISTQWGSKLSNEFLNWCNSLPGHVFRSFPLFCQTKGYPKDKFMKDRIIRAVTRFQAIWRGYLYKKAYPEALHAAKATEAINLNAHATLSTQSRVRRTRIKANFDPDDAQAEAIFYRENKRRVGKNSAILFDRGKETETIYSCEIVKISGESNGVQVYVRFHYDKERRKYHWRRFKRLENECHNFMTEMGIILVKFEGKISTTSHQPFWNGHN
jgi:hypothetical protein